MVRTVVFVFVLFLTPVNVLAQQPSSRSMDDLNWKEFQQLVPAKIKTVILTVGTLEAHGFINNGADNTVPVAIAKAIAGDINALIAPRGADHRYAHAAARAMGWSRDLINAPANQLGPEELAAAAQEYTPSRV